MKEKYPNNYISKYIYKIADFGVSKVLHSEEDMTSTGIGTPY